MDFIKFLNSKDIAEYLQKIDYKFSPEEAMFVIHEGRNIPLAEKHAAYEELIDRYPDHKLEERSANIFKGHTLSSFLRAYIDKENRLFEDCKRDGDDAIYYASHFSKADNSWIGCDSYDAVYHTFNDCFAKVHRGDAGNTAKVTIYKKYIKTNCVIELELLSDGTVLKVEGNSMPEDDFEIACAFEFMWIKIPTPFKRGDVVIPRREKIWGSRRYYDCEEAFVLTDMCTWGSEELAENGYKNAKSHKNNEKDFEQKDELIKHHEEVGDTSDMIAAGYFAGGSVVYHDHTISDVTYLDLEYYRGELEGRYRILKAVSNYIKGEISLDLLMQTYQLILLEEKVDMIKNFYLTEYCDDCLIKAGLK